MNKKTKIILLVVLAICMPAVGLPILLVVLFKDNNNYVQTQSKEQQSVSYQEKAERRGESIEKQSYTPNTKKVSNLEKNPREKALADNKKFSLVFLIVAIISGILSIVIDKIDGDEMGIFAMIFMWIFLLSCLLSIAGVADRKRVKRSYCPYCGEKYDYEEDVAWEVLNVTVSNNNKKADVEFQCVCSNCGEETAFTKNFTIAYFQNGKYVEKNIQTEAKKYFK